MADVLKSLATPGDRLAVNCHGCGMLRLIPAEIKLGDVFQLVTCPKCAVPSLFLRLLETGVEEVL